MFPDVPGSRFGSPPPPGMVPPDPKKITHVHSICSISELWPHICILFAVFQSHNLPLATYLSHLGAVYFLTKYLGTTYVLPACCSHISYVHLLSYVFLFHLYTTNSASINYSDVILLIISIHLYIIHCMPVYNLYTAHSVPIYYIPLSYSSTTDKLHHFPHPIPSTLQATRGNHIH